MERQKNKRKDRKIKRMRGRTEMRKRKMERKQSRGRMGRRRRINKMKDKAGGAVKEEDEG